MKGELARLRRDNAALRAQVDALQAALTGLAGHVCPPAPPVPLPLLPYCTCGTSAVCQAHPPYRPWVNYCVDAAGAAAAAPGVSTVVIPNASLPLTVKYPTAGCAGAPATLTFLTH